MAIERWATGFTSGWATAMSSEVDSLANGSAVISSIALTNGSSTVGYDLFADVQVTATGITDVAAPFYLGIYTVPLQSGGSVYGSGNLTTAAAAIVPPAQYFAGSISVATSTLAAVTGSVTRLVLPQGTFKFAIYNQTGATLPTSVTVQYFSYNRQVS